MTKCHRLVHVANGETMEKQDRGDRAAGKAGTQQAKHRTELLGKPEDKQHETCIEKRCSTF